MEWNGVFLITTDIWLEISSKFDGLHIGLYGSIKQLRLSLVYLV